MSRLVMMRRHLIFPLLAALGGCLLSSRPATAEEPVQKFLDGLRSRQMYDVAEEYLESLRNNAYIPAATKEIIPFEQGRTLVESSRTIRDLDLRMKELDKAGQRFQEFATTSSAHPLVASAQIQLGNVQVERGRAKLEMANRTSNTAEQKSQLLAQSREMFEAAIQVFQEAETGFDNKYNSYPKFIDQKAQPKLFEERGQALTDLIQAQLFGGMAIYEYAKSYDEDSAERKEQLQAAADKYKILFDKYRTRLAGLYAGMYQARCLQEMGDYQRALGIYSELLAQPDSPDAFRQLKSKVLRLALEIWTSDEQKKYEHAGEQGQQWIANSRGGEQSTPEGLAITYFTAVALDQQLQANPGNRAMSNEVVKHAKLVADSLGEFQKQGKELLAKYRDVNAEPQTFAEARDAGKAALDAMQAADNRIRLAPTTGENDKIPEIRKERAAAVDDAMRYFRMALALKDEETEVDDMNVVRYFLCFLHYSEGQFYDAAVMGEFLARNYPNSAGARQSAKIALAGYLQMYNSAGKDSRQFDANRMVAVAEYITEKWPAEAEADEAWMILGDIAIREQNLAKAAEYLGKIPEESPRRGQADLKAGQALWAAYLNGTQQEPPMPKAELDNILGQAQATLERGIARMREGLGDKEADYTLLASELSLAQIQLGAGKPEDALKTLESEGGPLAMLAASKPQAQEGNFPQETYKAALRAYVGMNNTKSAEDMMGKLDELVKGQPDAQRQLTRIYISLGRDVEQQVEAISKDPTRQKEAQDLVQAFSGFLTRIADSTQGNTFSSLNWVAETFFRLGSAIDTGASASAEAKKYYQMSYDTYKKLAARSDVPEGGPIAIQIRQAKCLRRMGDYEEAQNELTKILLSNNKMLEAQREAAYTYQEWALAKGSADFFKYAMFGGRRSRKTQQNIIWGWGKLASMVQRNPNYRDTFYEARYNLALCRFNQGGILSGTDKTDTLRLAKNDILIVQRLSKDMGGEAWFNKFDLLLKQIQRMLQEPATGLAGGSSSSQTASSR